MQLKRYLLLFISIIAFTVSAFAQKLTVESFVQTDDVIARSRNVIGTDGNVCAAVVVRIPSANATFDGGFIIGKPAYKNGEYIIDMQTGAAQMRVSVPGYNTIDVKFRDYLGSTLQSKTTYLLTINMPQSGAQQKMQTLNIKVTPSDAIVLIDGVEVEDYSLALPVGTRRYNVAAKGYHSQEGTIEIKESSPAKLVIELDKKQTTTQSNTQASNVIAPPVQQSTSAASQAVVAEDIYKKGMDYYEKNDYTQAVKFLKQAADVGHAEAQYRLGICYYNGRGVPLDYNQAVYWYRKAAEQGYVRAQNNLGACFEKGPRVIQNYTQAVYWYRKAAEQGDVKAQNNLGGCFEKGKGVTQDYTQAMYWYRKAAEQGYATAQYNLAQSYYYGQGVPIDKKQAKIWYEKAAEQGDATSKYRLKTLAF